MISVGVTTHNRRDIATETVNILRELTPGPVVVVDDGSTEPFPGADWRNPIPLGVAAAKNKCLELLDADEIFLFDDDTYPITEQWWQPFVDSPEPHLMHNFPSAPDHWRIRIIGGDDTHWAYDKPRGCMLYIRRPVLNVVGGFHTAFGRHGGEHADFSDRVHKAGLTRWAYASPKTVTIECRDQFQSGISSVPDEDKQQWRDVDATTLPKYADYR